MWKLFIHHSKAERITLHNLDGFTGWLILTLTLVKSYTTIRKCFVKRLLWKLIQNFQETKYCRKLMCGSFCQVLDCSETHPERSQTSKDVVFCENIWQLKAVINYLKSSIWEFDLVLGFFAAYEHNTRTLFYKSKFVTIE